MSEASDMAVKYQRLAQEYAKLKAQNQVLKKAIVESQEKSTVLQTNIQEKEQVIRRSEQEIDSSNFRCQQMVRRIESLQLELDQKDKRSKVADKNILPVSNVIDEDLQQKIIENEQLHKQLHAYNTEKRQMEQRFMDDLSTAKTEAKTASEALENLQHSHSQMVQQLENDKELLEKKLESISLELIQSNKDMSEKITHLQSHNDQLEQKCSQLAATIQDVVVFNDHSLTEMTNLKLVPHNKRTKMQGLDLFKSVKNLVGDFCKSLSDFHLYSKQRNKLYPVDATIQPLPETSLKFSQCCDETVSVLGNVLSSFSDAFTTFEMSQNEGILKLEDFSKCFTQYNAHFSKLLPYQLLILQEEYELSICVPTLQSKNSEFLASFKKCLPSISKLSTYLSYVVSTKEKADSDYASKVKFAYQKIISALNELHLVFKELSKSFNSKIALELQLPTTTTAPELTTANEFLLGSILSLSTISAKLSGLIQTNIDFISNAITSTKNSVMSIINISKKTVDFIDQVNLVSPPPSISYLEAIERKQDFHNENRQELLQQLHDVTNKLQSLEREKEHWLLETQLLQVKLEKVKSFENSFDENIVEKDRAMSASLMPLETSMLGTLDSSVDLVSSSKTTEELIKEHLTSRISEAALKAQAAEGKALHFENECRLLHKHLSVLRNKKEDLHNEVNGSSQRISQLQDELSVTRRSYEEQLSLMSEHLATMNDKLATQKDEIESLKNKTPKKSKIRLH